MTTVSVRYIVDDVDAAIGFYRDQLGFEVEMQPAPTFAMLARGDLRLLLSAPSGQGGGGQIMPDGRRPEPGGATRSPPTALTHRPRGRRQSACPKARCTQTMRAPARRACGQSSPR